MWSTPENLDSCPVRLFELYVSKRPPQMCEPQSPFYLSVNRNPSDVYWYKKQRMGTNTLGQIMSSLAKKANLQGKKTNHSARKTMISKLAKHNVLETQIIQLSGHRNLHSLNAYKTATIDQQKEMSHILSISCSGKNTTNGSSTMKTDPHTVSQNPHSFFQGAHLSGCTLNIGFPLQQMVANNMITTHAEGPPAKVPRTAAEN